MHLRRSLWEFNLNMGQILSRQNEPTSFTLHLLFLEFNLVWYGLDASYMCLQTTQPPSPICSSSLPSSLNLNHLSRPRKPRDTKPKMKKLKYHQYIPPDQRRGTAGEARSWVFPEWCHLFSIWFAFVGCCLTVDFFLFEVGGAKQKSPTSMQSLDPAYSHLLKQPQVFLQLQILQNQQQQQLTVVPKYVMKSCSDICLVRKKLL